MKLKLNTIIIFARDVEKLKTFYFDLLKFNLIEEIKAEWVLFDCGGCNIGLHKIGKDYADEAAENHQNNTKIVFETEDIFSIRASLILQNIRVGEIKTFENYDYWVCDGEDPEGNIFQLKQKK